MSIHTLTLDEFMRLDAATHRVALAQYDGAIDAALALSHAGLPAEARATHLDQLTSLLTLRKVHRGALAELEEETQAAAPRPVSQQYFDHELDQLPS